MTIDRQELVEELLLRENIRKAIKVVLKRKEDSKNREMLEEEKLREVIRMLIKEEAAEAPSESTAINVLEELLKKIIPVLEEDFKSLTTSKEQRESFRAHVLNGIENLLAPAEVNADVDNEEDELDPIDELLQRITEVRVSIGDKMPAEFIDIYGGTEEDEEEEPASEEEEFARGLEDRDYDLVGRNMALRSFKKISQNISDSFDIVSPDEEDRETFYDYLITNVKLYFDKFEEELDPTPEEPTTKEYEREKDKQEDLNLDEYVDLDSLLEGIEG